MSPFQPWITCGSISSCLCPCQHSVPSLHCPHEPLLLQAHKLSILLWSSGEICEISPCWCPCSARAPYQVCNLGSSEHLLNAQKSIFSLFCATKFAMPGYLILIEQEQLMF